MAEEETVSASGFPWFSAQLLQSSRAEMPRRQSESSTTEGQMTSVVCSNDAGHTPSTRPCSDGLQLQVSAAADLSFRSRQPQTSAVDLPHTPMHRRGIITWPHLQTLTQESGHLPEGFLCSLYPEGHSPPLLGFHFFKSLNHKEQSQRKQRVWRHAKGNDRERTSPLKEF